MNTPATASRPSRVWLPFLAGALLFFVGPVGYFAQLGARQLWTPWYVPLLASVGLLLMAASLWRRPGAVRFLGLAAFGLLCGLEWYFLLVASKTPAYAGPALPGRQIPAFAARRADGGRFTDENLRDGTPSLLVFFRGRW